MKWLKRITWAMFIAGYLMLMFWMTDKTVARHQDRWDRQTVGMASQRPSTGD